MRTDVLVVGAGQAGLAMSRRLGAAGVDHLVVDGAGRVGDSWRARWDSLRLFTPRPYAQLPGLRYPPGTPWLPSKDDVADHLERYAQRHGLPVRLGTGVTTLQRSADGFCAELQDGQRVTASAVVAATGPYGTPRLPSFAPAAFPLWTLHSSQYRRPAQVPEGRVIVVGAGNTGAQLAVELHDAGREVVLAASRPPWYLPTRVLGIDTYRWLRWTGTLTAGRDAPVSRYVRSLGDPIVGTRLRRLVQAGAVVVRPRAVGVDGDRWSFADGSQERAGSALWATGFSPSTGWIDVPGALGPDGEPVHTAGASPVPGLFWLGLPYQRRMDSALLHGADADARAALPAVLAARRTVVDHTPRESGGPVPR